MAHRPEEWAGLRFLAGRLCLDFVNSIEDRAGDKPEDFIETYPDLIRWGRHRELLTAVDTGRLIVLADEDESGAAATLEAALRLRTALHRVFQALATNGELEVSDLEHIQCAYAQALPHARLLRAGDRFAWEWSEKVLRLDQVLWAIAYDAIELLTNGHIERVRVCANPHGCGWLFYDGSKNGSRRWCSMEGCGSQVKMRRQYAKRKATTAT